MDDGNHESAIEQQAQAAENQIQKFVSRRLQHQRSREQRFQNDLAHLIPRYFFLLESCESHIVSD